MFSLFRYANRCLAHSRLGVEAAFAGNDVIGILDGIGQANGVEDDLDTRTQAAVQISQEGESHTTGCTGTGCLAIVMTGISLGDGGKRPAGIVQDFDILRRCTFLGPEDIGGAPISVQRIGHITGDIEGTVFQSRQDLGIIDRNNVPHFLSA